MKTKCVHSISKLMLSATSGIEARQTENHACVMESTKRDFLRRKSNGKFSCTICSAELSTKQRILTHLHKKHNLTPVRREKKLYLDNTDIPVPRSTSYRWKKQQIKGQSVAPSKKKLFECDGGTPTHSHSSHLPETSSRYSQYDQRNEGNYSKSSHECNIISSREMDISTPDISENNDLSFQASAIQRSGTDENEPDERYFQSEVSSSSGTKKVTMPDYNDDDHSDMNETNELDSSISMENILSDYETPDSDCTSSDSDETVSSNFSPSNSNTESLSASGDSDQDSVFENYVQDEERIEHMTDKEFQSLSLLSCFLRNQLSVSASKDIIETLKKTFPKSKEVNDLDWEKMLSHIDSTSLKEFHYCILCSKVFPEDEDVFRCQSCEGLRYKGSLGKQTSRSRQPRQSFVFADVHKQLADLLQTPGIWADIQETKRNAYERLNSGSSNLTDILDGHEYRKLMKTGFLKESNNLTAIFNTDGVNLYSSSKTELWPIYLALNELSPPKRFSRENILLVGMWQGKGKPPFHEYFKIFSDYMNTLYTSGVEVSIDNVKILVKLKIVCGVMDLPAKAELLNMSYFNGQYPCISCEEDGKTVKQGKGNAKCLPYKIQGNRSMQRMHELVLENMRSGCPNNRSKGFKGESGLSYLTDFDLVQGIVPDYMHGVCLGVTKAIMCKWFSPKEKSKEYFIGDHIEEVSTRMQFLKPPHSIERLPRNLEKNYQSFKATEFQTWLLYYAFPCVEDFLKDEYLENFSYLSEGIHILLGDDISQESLIKARDLLDQFYASFQRLYGDGSCGLNIHNTGLHLCDYVKLWGPVWCWSCFPFEDINAMLLNSIHGTGVVLKQVMRFRQSQMCIRRRGLQLKKDDGWKISHRAANCDVAGAMQPLYQNELEDSVKMQLSRENILEEMALKKVNRIVVNRKRFYSEQYMRMQKRICTVVLHGNHEIAKIKYFILCENKGLVYAVLEHFQKVPPSMIEGARMANHYSVVSNTHDLLLINVDSLKEVVVYLDVNTRNGVGKQYVIQMPNQYGHAVFK
ncbi:uncharacterized protein [Argopecten irradians]|uniref:uncharacterized protein n=1 Tax=Argopecten irradians TaxID=31199 RepID=UPI00371F027E